MKFRYLILLLYLLFFSNFLLAQGNPKKTGSGDAALQLHEVSGIVQDSTFQPLSGVTVSLKSGTDTLITKTDDGGAFFFEKIAASKFVITASYVGYRTVIRRFSNDPRTKNIILDPIVFSVVPFSLDEVKVNGAPTISYKTDTVEYRASDYKTHEYDNISELVRKMEGVELSANGNLSYQGQQVKKAKLNGKIYAGGDVAQAITTLPADIVDKLQFVNDYGEQSARTGIKNGDPTLVLNVVTRADKSNGLIQNYEAGYGNNNRYTGTAIYQRLNGNRQWGFIGNIKNTINGVANRDQSDALNGTGNTAAFNNKATQASAGNTAYGGPTLNYRDQWGKFIQVNGAYIYNYSKIHSLSESATQLFSPQRTTFSDKRSEANSDNRTHNLSFEVEYSPDKNNYFNLTSVFNHNSINNQLTSQVGQQGYLNQTLSGTYNEETVSPVYGSKLLYQHVFNSRGRNVSVQYDFLQEGQKQDNRQNSTINFNNANQTTANDSLVNLITVKNNISRNNELNFTYTEPINESSQINFIGKFSDLTHHLETVASKMASPQGNLAVDSLSNIFDYSFKQGFFTANYVLAKSRFNFTIGVTGIWSKLQTGLFLQDKTSGYNQYYIIPSLKFLYNISRTQRISLDYLGSPKEPFANQLQAVKDFSNPINPVFGNPYLKPSFSQSIRSGYDNYLPNQKLNLSLKVRATFIKNNVVNKTIYTVQPNTNSIVQGTTFTNEDGTYNLASDYNISKQSNDRKYKIELIGSTYYSHLIGVNNEIKNTTAAWRFYERLGPRFNPSETFEINPFLSFDYTRSNNDLIKSFNSSITTTALTIDGKCFFKATTIGYTASKNFIRGISSDISSNPLVINAYLERRYFKKRNVSFKLEIFDLLNQNRYINRFVTDNSITDIKTNALSRYFLGTISLNLQSWGRVNGQQIKRKNDGSFY